MLRKMRFEGPAARYCELVEAARGSGHELDDYAIDTTDAYGWPMFGNRCAVVIAVVDDDWWTPQEVAAALRAAHERNTGTPGDWIVAAGSFVYLPDGLACEWYDEAGRLAEALHEAERTGQADCVARLREEVVAAVEATLPVSDAAFAHFEAGVRRLAGSSPRDRLVPDEQHASEG